MKTSVPRPVTAVGALLLVVGVGVVAVDLSRNDPAPLDSSRSSASPAATTPVAPTTTGLPVGRDEWCALSAAVCDSAENLAVGVSLSIDGEPAPSAMIKAVLAGTIELESRGTGSGSNDEVVGSALSQIVYSQLVLDGAVQDGFIVDVDAAAAEATAEFDRVSGLAPQDFAGGVAPTPEDLMAITSPEAIATRAQYSARGQFEAEVIGLRGDMDPLTQQQMKSAWLRSVIESHDIVVTGWDGDSKDLVDAFESSVSRLLPAQP